MHQPPRSWDLLEVSASPLDSGKRDRVVTLLAAGLERYLRAAGPAAVDFSAELRVYTDDEGESGALHG
jgi:hypothetical protein